MLGRRLAESQRYVAVRGEEGKGKETNQDPMQDGKHAKEEEEKEGKRSLLAQTHLQNFHSPLQPVSPFQSLLYLYSDIITNLIPRSHQEKKHALFSWSLVR